jgi:FixJ family two-component response regulator
MTLPAHIYIAVVDDDESVCRALSRLLRASGMQPITYSSTEAFLADQKHPAFDCLVLDIQFEGMSGIELKRRLKAAGSRTPVIFVSGSDNPEIREEALATGCVAFFRKPEAGSGVLDAIRSAIAA